MRLDRSSKFPTTNALLGMPPYGNNGRVNRHTEEKEEEEDEMSNDFLPASGCGHMIDLLSCLGNREGKGEGKTNTSPLAT